MGTVPLCDEHRTATSSTTTNNRIMDAQRCNHIIDVFINYFNSYFIYKIIHTIPFVLFHYEQETTNIYTSIQIETFAHTPVIITA